MNTQIKDAGLNQCLDLDCKSKPERFNFCKLHYEQFKFGVIKKNGLKPVDYEKKLTHYNNYLKKLKLS